MNKLLKVLMVTCCGLLLLVGVDAHATLVVSTYCFSYATSLTDAAVGDLLTGGHTEARGARVKFIQETGYTVVNDVWLDESTGCITLDGLSGTSKLDNGMTYTVQVQRDALINSNFLLVRASTGGTIVSQVTTGFHPVANRTYSYANGDSWTRLSSSDSVNIMAAASFAFQREMAGLVTETFEFRAVGCGGTGSNSCFEQSTEILWIASPDRKFTTAKILGLAIAGFSNDHDGVSKNSSAAVDDCIPNISTGGVLMNSKEYTSAAAYEGFGSFYAAVAFNDDSSYDDCEFSVEVAVDWNADQAADDTDEDRIFSCQDSPAPNQSPPIGDANYFEEKCTATGTFNNRSTQYDWLRFLWDYHTDHPGIYMNDYRVDDIFAIWNGADPDTWTASGDFGGTSGDYPIERLITSEGNGTSGIFWSGMITHGVEN